MMRSARQTLMYECHLYIKKGPSLLHANFSGSAFSHWYTLVVGQYYTSEKNILVQNIDKLAAHDVQHWMTF
jgi:hypothetical protein